MMDILSNPDLWIYLFVGFAAQIVDGALGMAYGTLCTSILLATGVPPAAVSVSVHSAQFFTTGISGLSHAWFRNVDKRLFLLLAVFGVIGGLAGAIVLAHVDAKVIRPWISFYLLLLGVAMLAKLFLKKGVQEPLLSSPRKRFRALLGLFGGFLDAIGGGWGPLVTTTLLHQGENPRMTIGSVNSAEFFVKTTIALTLFTAIGIEFPIILLGLLTGGVLAAPLGAYLLRLIKPQALVTLASLLIISLSVYSIVQAVL